MDRLREKGLHGVLHSLDGYATSGNDTFHTMRHLHPREVGLLNGMNPKHVSNCPEFHLRLELAAVGQMASPIQSNWVISQVLFQMSQQKLIPECKHPRVVMVELCKSIMKSRDEVWQKDTQTIYQQAFEREIEAICKPIVRVSPHDDESMFTQSLKEAIPLIESSLGLNEPRAPSSMSGSNGGSGKGKGGTSTLPSGSSKLKDNQPFPAVVEHNACKPETSPPSIRSVENAKTAFDHNGGVAGFETAKRKDHPQTMRDAKKVKIAEKVDCSPTQVWTQPVVAEMHHEPQLTDLAVNQESTAIHESSHTVWVGYIGEPRATISVTPKTTVGQLLVAEANLVQAPSTNFRAFGIVGETASNSTELHNGDILLIQNSEQWTDPKCPLQQTSFMPPNLQGMTRAQALLRQLGWVAGDEMQYYLQDLGNKQDVLVTPPVIIEDDDRLETWFRQQIEIAKAADGCISVYTCCLAEQHWFPLCFRVGAVGQDPSEKNEDAAKQMCVLSTPEGLERAFPVIQQILVQEHEENNQISTCQSQAIPVVNKFPADCGFQAVAWIKARAMQASNVGMSSTDAYSLRCAFAKQLIQENIDQNVVHYLDLGGMQDNHIKRTSNGNAWIEQELKTLLEQHGVGQDRSLSVVEILVEKLGVPAIKSILSSPRAWQDLKTRASACKPAIQLVLAEELRRVVESRIKEGKPFGRKENKKKNSSTTNGPLRIDASQVVIPSTVFQQDDGSTIPQVAAHDIHAQTKGIVVLNIDDAMPYFGLREQISQEGLGLLVLEHNDKRLPPVHQVVRFPATCVGTQEPMLVTAALFQLGKKEVGRNIPKERSKVDEISTMVIRAVLFRDEFKRVAWEDFSKKPVKHLFEMEPFEDIINGAIIDVWDRQHLTKVFKKCRQEEAELFLVTFRVATTDGQNILQFSGKDGVYFEPRSENGRQPHPSFRVVWIPKMTLGAVHLARQTAPKPTWVVRNGDRFGLRASIEDIEEIHAIHKPDIPFMDGSSVQNYRIEPLPFGTTKQSLMRAFKAWGWEARPIQPQGQTRDHQGVAWTAVAATNPTHWVYTMEHGDVVVSIHKPSKEQSSSSTAGAPLASNRTLKHLSEHRPAPAQPVETSGDPFQSNDPWAQWQPTTANRQTKPLSVSQIASIEANIEKKVLATIQTGQGNDDTVMAPVIDGRVDHLEKQVKQLHDTVGKMQQNMQSFQTQQVQHNTQVVNEIGGVKQQVEHQNNTLRSMLDSKLEDQMNRIEALLSKKAKTSQE